MFVLNQTNLVDLWDQTLQLSGQYCCLMFGKSKGWILDQKWAHTS